MKQNKLFLGLATMFAAAFTFTACTSDDAESQSAQQDRTIRLTSSVERGSTRATSDPQPSTSLSTSSSLGVFAINNSTALTNGSNEQYSVDGSGNLNPTTTANKMTWPASGNVSFYAYAPYAEGTTYNSANSFSVKTDQTTEANYLASDLVLAKNEDVAETSSAVELSFNHLMAKINITIQKATNATVDLTNAKVSIINIQPTCTFKPNATGSGDDKVLGAASGDATEITLVSALGNVTTGTACGIIVPQTLAANTGLVKIQTAPGTANNRILIAKLSAETTFASGQSYNFTAEIADPAAPITYITLKLGSTNLVAWGNKELGASTKEFCLGDYILSDGSLLKANDVDFATKKANVVAVIFSNNVCENDASYDGYAVSIDGKLSTNNLAWSTSAGSVGDLKANLSDAIADYSGLKTKTTASANYEAYPVFQCTGAPTVTGDNLSKWFVPSVGQMVDIIQNLGEQSNIRNTITTEGASQSGNNNISISTSISTFLPKINAYAVAVKGEGKVIITASGDGSSDGNCFQYVTSTEKDASNMWMIKFPAADAANQRIYLSRAAGKTGTSNRNVLPIIAFKVK